VVAVVLGQPCLRRMMLPRLIASTHPAASMVRSLLLADPVADLVGFISSELDIGDPGAVDPADARRLARSAKWFSRMPRSIW
jgi:hypothetical protein